MKTKPMARFLPVVLAVMAMIFSLAERVHAQTETVLYTFGNTSAGEFPFGAPVSDAAGNLYGTTSYGANSNAGMVFELSPTSSGHWRRSVLHYFGGTNDGRNPTGPLIFDAAGNLYGMTQAGGILTDCEGGGCGIVFKLAPTSSGPWHETILHSFTGLGDGRMPEVGASLTFDSAGNLYGTTGFGGNLKCEKATEGCGVVFRLSPISGGGWKETVLRQFSGADGAYVAGSVIFDLAGNLYGTTLYGGTGTGCGGNMGCGVVFELSPTTSGPWSENVLYNLTGASDGAFPLGSLIRDASGTLYGTATQGGNSDSDGTVFKISPGSGGTWTETTLYQFTGGSDGVSPSAPLAFDASGNLYGQTTGDVVNCGSVFELLPSAGGWTESTIHAFTCGVDGGNPGGGLIFDSAGRIYGTASNDSGTAPNVGVVFQITP